MALPKTEEIQNLSDQEITEQIIATKRQLFELRFQKATRQPDVKPHQFKHARHRLAQLMTIERQRQLKDSAKTKGSAPQDASPVTTSNQSESKESELAAEGE